MDAWCSFYLWMAAGLASTSTPGVLTAVLLRNLRAGLLLHGAYRTLISLGLFGLRHHPGTLQSGDETVSLAG